MAKTTPDAERTRRLHAAYLIASTVAIGAHVTLRLRSGHPEVAQQIALFSSPLLIVLVSLLSGRWTRVAAHTFPFVAALLCVTTALSEGGIYAPSLWYLSMSPFVAAHLLGAGAATIWAGLATAALIGVYLGVPLEALADDAAAVADPFTAMMQRAVLVLLATAFAVTARRTSDSALATALERQRTIEAQQKELVSARDAALAAADAKAAFLAAVSHELRTPLNGIVGSAELLRGERMSESDRSLLGTIRHSATTLRGLVDDLLDLSKLDAGGVRYVSEPFSLDDCVADAAELVALGAERHGLTLFVDLGDAPIHVRGDELRVRQVVVNLLGNAVKFTEAGTVSVHASRATARLRDGVRIEVRDTGRGIPEADFERIFESFEQVDRADGSRPMGGTGLGLAIARRVVEQMGGTVQVRSELDRGSTFSVELPLPEDERANTGSSEGLLARQRALLLDGHDGRRVARMGTLRRMKMRVDEVATATQLQAKLTSSAPDSYGVVWITSGRLDTPLDALVRTVRASAATAKACLVVSLQRDERETAAATMADIALLQPPRFAEVRERLAAWHRLEDGRAGEGPARRPDRVVDPGPTRLVPDAVVGARTPRTPSARESGMIAALPVTALTQVAPSPAPRASMPRLAADTEPTAQARRPRVLVIEDNEINRDIAVRMLEHLGVEVGTATDGARGVEAFEDAAWDLVFIDCDMPVMDGFEATRRIRARGDRGAHVPIVALTASALEGDQQRCLAAGMTAHLSKPVRIANLHHALRTHVPQLHVGADATLAEHTPWPHPGERRSPTGGLGAEATSRSDRPPERAPRTRSQLERKRRTTS